MRLQKLLTTTAVMAVMAGSPALAADANLMKELKALKSQLQTQQNLIQKLESRLDTDIKKQSQDIAKLKSKPSSGGVTGDVKISMSPTLKVESTDGRYSFQPFGRVQVDYASFDDDKTDHPDGATFRRARLGFKGKIDQDLKYKLELDFGNKGSTDSASFNDVYLEYTGFKKANIRVGHFKPAYGLEELTSSNYITMIERSLPTGSFASSYVTGLQVYGGGSHHSWAAGVHNDKSSVKSSDDEAKSFVGRFTFAPVASEGRTLHLGVSQAYRIPDASSDSVAFDTQAENAIQRLESAETGTITGVDSVHLTGIEAAGVYGPLSVQGEYFHNSINRKAATDLSVNGWYGQASYFLTGESRPYSAKSGTFGRVKPNNPFSLKEGGLGAWELAARYSSIDLNDGTALQGGAVKDITLGVNWYLNSHTRLMANYIMVDSDAVKPSGSNVAANDDPNIFLVRAAVDF